MTWGLIAFTPDFAKMTYPLTTTNEGPVGAETLFMASATIMALTVFGSVLGMRIQNRPKNLDLGWIAKIYTFIPIMALIFIQSLFMLLLVLGIDVYDKSLGLSPIVWWISGMTFCLVAVAFFVFVANFYSSD